MQVTADRPNTLDALVASLPADLVVDVVAGNLGTGNLGTGNLVAELDTEIVDFTHDSRQVAPGWGFACVSGARHDGHEFAAGAVAAGAALLLVERALPLDVAQIVVRDVRRAMGPVAAAVHGHPATKLRTIGITGTNGKTTTAQLIAAILRGAGMTTLVQGTLSGARTTPEAPDLQRLLARAVADGCEAVVMEVSSHALALSRVAGMRFDVAVFTNLGRDHLDLHESMEAYFRAKASLFVPELAVAGVTNVDDTYGRLLLDAAEIPMTVYSRDDARGVDATFDHIDFEWRGHRVSVPLGGQFHVMNALAALTAASVAGVDDATAAAAIAWAPPVPGRFEVVSDPARDRFTVVVDYAHTPDGLVEVLTAARAVASGGRVVVVFGCGGNRDADKRPLMGAAAARHADAVVITSDNPRDEDPQTIVDAAWSGVDASLRDRVEVVVDRRDAIDQAIRAAQPGDVVVIAGKGHETTQTIGDRALPFDDREIARAALASAADMSMDDPT